jgi:XrtJ-associated TM-motif-TM protein
MKKLPLVVAAVGLLLVSSPLFAQNGCLDSPENPTAILAVAGSAGALLVAVRDRFRRK